MNIWKLISELLLVISWNRIHHLCWQRLDLSFYVVVINRLTTQSISQAYRLVLAPKLHLLIQLPSEMRYTFFQLFASDENLNCCSVII